MGEKRIMINLTESAVNKVDYFIKKKEGSEDVFLRVGAMPGGCSGLKYQLVFDNKISEDDIITEYGNVKVITDKFSNPYVDGMTIDFVDTIEKQGFTIDNPNATNSCACGSSFS